MDFTVSADYRIKMKVKKPWNIKVEIIPIVFGALVTVLKSLKKRLKKFEIRERVETTQTTLLLRLVKILRESRTPEKTCRQSVSSEISPEKGALKKKHK